jgi:hypothetical protein
MPVSWQAVPKCAPDTVMLSPRATRPVSCSIVGAMQSAATGAAAASAPATVPVTIAATPAALRRAPRIAIDDETSPGASRVPPSARARWAFAKGMRTPTDASAAFGPSGLQELVATPITAIDRRVPPS